MLCTTPSLVCRQRSRRARCGSRCKKCAIMFLIVASCVVCFSIVFHRSPISVIVGSQLAVGVGTGTKTRPLRRLSLRRAARKARAKARARATATCRQSNASNAVLMGIMPWLVPARRSDGSLCARCAGLVCACLSTALWPFV